MAQKGKKMKRILLSLLFVLCVSVLTMGDAMPVSAATKSLNYKEKTVEKGKSFTLTVKGKAKKDKVKYSSSKSSVAKVNSSGKVTGKKEGTATITVTVTPKTGSATTLKCNVTVCKKKSLSYSEFSVEEKSNFKLAVKNLEKGQKVKYSTSDATIAKVNSSGKVTGIGVGVCSINAKILDKKGKEISTLTCRVTVTAYYLPSFEINDIEQEGDLVLTYNPKIDMTFSVNKTISVLVSVVDGSDRAVWSKTVKMNKNEPKTISWNGRTNSGAAVDNGTYCFKVSADSVAARSGYFRVYSKSDFSSGNGTATYPYALTSVEDIRKMTEHRNCHFYLTTDIDFNYDGLYGLFSADAPFTGTLDGKNHRFVNMVNQNAIFSNLGETGVIKNLTIDTITKSTEAYGLLVQNNHGTIENCVISNIVAGNWSFGSIAYENWGMIRNCSSSGELKGGGDGNLYVGGIVCFNQSTGKVLNCTSSLNVDLSIRAWYRDYYIGGIVASNNGFVSMCKTSGQYSGNSNYLYIGAIAGRNAGTVQGCSYAGTQTDLNLVGEGSNPIG